jgi:dihydroorotase
MSILIKNCNILDNGGLISKNIYIKEGKIEDITDVKIKADKVIDANSNFVMPGAIDCHVHFREPGFEYKEDFLFGSYAAARGGITTVLDMPNTNPATTTIKLLEEKRALAKKSIVNYGFNFGSTLSNLAEIKKANNIASVKVYMDKTTGNLVINDLEAIKKILEVSKLTVLHAEGENIKKVIEILEKNNIKNHIHIAHLSSEKELSFAKGKSIKGQITVEVTPHHLFLNSSDLEKHKAFAEMKPSLKSEKDNKVLWNALQNGKIDIIATDHAPHTKEEKESQNFPYGVPGEETMLPLLFDAYNKKKITLKKIVEVCSLNPAKIFKIKNKGQLRIGFDADLTIVDLEKIKTVKGKDQLSKCKWTPFEGKILKGWPVTTLVNGNIVYDNGKIFDIKAKEVQYG